MKFSNLCFFFSHVSNIKSLQDTFSKNDIENFMCMGNADGWDRPYVFISKVHYYIMGHIYCAQII
jgi:hypothetical protein